jgi:Tfp pilus assembly protein PilO
MRDRVILLSLAIVGLLAAFYFMILSPKRDEASKLKAENTQLQASIDEQKAVAAFAEEARQDFPRYYSRLVVLGKAVPDQADQASMLVQLSQIADSSGVEFRSIKVAEGAGAASTSTSPTGATTTPPTDGTTTTDTATTTTPNTGTNTTPSDGTSQPATGTSTGGGTTTTPAATSTTPAPATEATAASLPIGATVGPAGLPILPYDLTFKGSFFDIAEFMSGVDSLVNLREGSGQLAANGRLTTVDGFALKPLPQIGGVPDLVATFAVTTYVVPSDQGLTAGASPTSPGASPTQPQATPASTTTPTVSP